MGCACAEAASLLALCFTSLRQKTPTRMLLRRSRSSLTAAAAGATLLLRGRAMGTVSKGTTRAAVHGSRSPTNTTVEDREAMEGEIERGKEKVKMREHVEDKVGARTGGRSGSGDHKPAK